MDFLEFWFLFFVDCLLSLVAVHVSMVLVVSRFVFFGLLWQHLGAQPVVLLVVAFCC